MIRLRVAEQAALALAERNAVLLANHGLVGVGVGLREAVTVCELVERAAHVYILARSLGQAHNLPDEIVALEKQLFRMTQLKRTT